MTAETILVVGCTGAGKTTYARKLADELGALRFSIDEWMMPLFGPDQPTPIRFDWMMERVNRCEAMIFSLVQQAAARGLLKQSTFVLPLAESSLERLGNVLPVHAQRLRQGRQLQQRAGPPQAPGQLGQAQHPDPDQYGNQVPRRQIRGTQQPRRGQQYRQLGAGLQPRGAPLKA